jgi:hypothetical protein
MDPLIEQIAQRTGITPDQAKAAVEQVVAFLRTRVPAPLAEHLDAALSGQAGGGLMDQAKGMLGGLLSGAGEQKG